VFKFGSATADDFAMTSNTTAPRTLVSDESVVGCTLDEVSVVVLGDRLVVVPIAREAALSSGFELAEVPDHELVALGILPRPTANSSVSQYAELTPIPTNSPSPLLTPQPYSAQVVTPVVSAPEVAALQVSAPQVSVPQVSAAQPSTQQSVLAEQPILSEPVASSALVEHAQALPITVNYAPVEQLQVPVEHVQVPQAPQSSVQQVPLEQAASAEPAVQPVVATPVECDGAFRGFSSVAVPSASPGQPAASNAPELLAPAPAPDFSAWPYVDRRSLTVDDDVPTAQNFLNAAVASERRGRNADVAPVQAAPFGDVPRAYDSSASDTRAKPEPRIANAPSTVEIGMASLPAAPQPTVVPSPTTGGSYDPERATAIPKPIVIPAPVRASAPTSPAPTGPAPTASAIPASAAPAPAATALSPESAGGRAAATTIESRNSPLPVEDPDVKVEDISESPLARLLAAQGSEHSESASLASISAEPASAAAVALEESVLAPVVTETAEVAHSAESSQVQQAIPSSTQPSAQTSTQALAQSTIEPQTSVEVQQGVQPQHSAQPHSVHPHSVQSNTPLSMPSTTASPFAAPKVGRGAGLFAVVSPLTQQSSSAESMLEQTLPEQTPSDNTGNTPVSSALSSGEAAHQGLAPLASVFGAQTPAHTPSSPAQREPQSQALPQPAVVVPSEASPQEAATEAPAAATGAPMPFSIPDVALSPVAEEPVESVPAQTRLSPEALQQVYTFDDDNPEDLVPLGVSDRLVLRWNPNADEELRVSTVGLSIGWPTAKPLVANLDIDLVSGDILVVDGPERSGKTALLKTFAGHQAPLQGDVSLNGHSLGNAEGTDFRRREALSLCYVGANSLLVSDLSLVENIELPLLAEGVSPHDARPAALAWLESAGLSANAHLPAGALSNSDSRIAAVIRTLISGPALVCVDDVTSGMGISSARMVLALLEHAQSTGTVLLIATNDARLEFDGGYRANIEAGELVPVE
jgi:putative ABC transport system ATP-binding protein